MKAAVISFPGSNCDLDLQWAVQTIAGAECELIKPSQTDLSRYDVVMVPVLHPVIFPMKRRLIVRRFR